MLQNLLHRGNFQGQGQPDDRAKPRTGLDQALPVELLGAVLHAGHAVTTVKTAVQLHRDALAVVLDGKHEHVVGEVHLGRDDDV